MGFWGYCAEIETIVTASGEPLEGNCVYYDQSLTVFPELENKRLNLSSAAERCNEPGKKVCEIGFNAGHSALLLFLSAPEAEFVLFDLGSHAYTKPSYEYIDGQLPQVKKTIHYGDSRVTIPLWISANPEEIGTFDLVHVDGGHTESCVASDLAMAILLVRKGGIVILDDTNDPMVENFFKLWEGRDVLRRLPQLETPNNTYAHIVAKRTFRAW